MNSDFNSLDGMSGRRLMDVAVCFAAICFALALPSAQAREVRVATYNILDGTGDIGSAEYNAVQAQLARIDADIVCFQELYMTSYAAWTNLATQLGYPYAAISGNGPFSGNLYDGYFSRFPILSTYNVNSPPGAVELSRYPFRAVIDVPDTQHPLVLWTMHHKSGATSIDKFRRAIEAYRIVQDINAYLAANPANIEYVLTGDMNDDIRDSQTAQYTSQPSGAPGSYVLGADIVFPVAYATFPTDRYAGAGAGLLHVPAYWEGTTTPITRPSSSRQLDYIFLSPAIVNNPLGAPQAEVYYSDYDTGGGLPKAGTPLPSGTSTTASDHLPVFVDIQMADYSTVLPTAGFESIGEVAGPFDPPSKIYTLTDTNAFDTAWIVEVDVDWLTLSEDSFWLSPFTPLEVEVALNANAALLAPGVHEASISFWNETTDLLEIREVILTIPDYLDVGPEDGLFANGIPGGPFSPASKTYVVTNKSTSAHTFTATATENWVSIAPSSWLLQAGEAVEVVVGLNANANALPIGTYGDTVVFSNQTTGLVQERPVTLAIQGALCDAVDRCDLVWTTGGNGDWFHQTTDTFDGTDAAQSGPVSSSQQSWMETVVTGPVQIDFQWRVSSRSTHYLRFQVDGVSQASISGESTWTQRTFAITSGVHTLRWVFTNTTTAPQGSNSGWVDQISIDYLAAMPMDTWFASGTPGGPFTPATRQYVLTNSGVSTLQWAVTTNVAWISADPTAGELEPGGSLTVELSLNGNALALPAGTHAGSVTFSNQTTGRTFLRQVSLAIQDYLVITPSYSWHTGFVGGPYSPTSQTYAISNSGSVSVDWTVTQTSNWVAVDSMGGTIEPGTVSNIMVSLTTNANVFPAGWNYAQLTFTNLTTQLSQTRWVYLEVLESLAVTSSEWMPSGPAGGPFSPAFGIYTLTNQSSIAQNWTVSASTNWLTLDTAGGTLASNSGTQITATLNANATALPLGVYSAVVVFSNQTTGATLPQSIVLSVGVDFCDAVEACGSSWTFGGDTPWLFQTNVTQDGIDAAASGTITDSQESWMETSVTGPGSLSFWWQVSSESNYDYLEFWIDGIRTNRISGTVDWQQQTYTLGSDTHLLRWRYMKDSSVSSGSDRGWVDLVAWAPGRTAMGVPIAWYERFGLAPGAGETWDDLDLLPSAAGAPHWFQYVAGLDPTYSNEVFQIFAIQQSNGQPTRIEWWGGTNGPAAPYVIQSALDMELGPWDPVGSSPRTAGVNIWTNAEPADLIRYYRILAVPDP